MRMALAAAALLLAGCATPALDDPAPEAPTGRDGQPDGRGGLRLPTLLPAPGAAVSSGSEPSILADRNGKFLWIGDSDGGKWSGDNGTTWHPLPDFVLPGAFTDGWALAQDGRGRLYAAALQGSDIDVARSSDGKTWELVTRAAAVSGITDRPWMAANGDGEVALFYYDLLGEYCVRSTDGGATWLDRNPLAGPPQGGRAFFDASGAFHYSSTDGNVYRFEGSCGLSQGEAIPFVDPGVNNMIQAVADGDDLYLAAATDGAQAITLAGKHPGGAVKRLAVSPPGLKANTFATLAARGGAVAVAWYGSETGGDPSSSFSGDFRVYLALVRGFWTAEPKVDVLQVTATPNHEGTICMGGIGCTSDRELLDYFMVDLDVWGGVHVAYVDDVQSPGGATYHAHFPPASLPAATPPASDPHAAFLAAPRGLQVQADASPSEAAAGSTLVSYAWDWGDGGKGAGLRANHTYGGIGAYTVRLTVTDSAGRFASAAQQVLVEGGGPSPPQPSPAPPTSPPSPAPASSTATAPASGTSSSQASPLPLPLLAVALAALLARARPGPQPLSRLPLSRRR